MKLRIQPYGLGTVALYRVRNRERVFGLIDALAWRFGNVYQHVFNEFKEDGRCEVLLELGSYDPSRRGLRP